MNVYMVLERIDMDVNEQYRLFIVTLRHEYKQRNRDCCAKFLSHRRVFNNEQNPYPKMSIKQPLD